MLVLELCEKGELFDLLYKGGLVPYDICKEYFRQLMVGIHYCHGGCFYCSRVVLVLFLVSFLVVSFLDLLVGFVRVLVLVVLVVFVLALVLVLARFLDILIVCLDTPLTPLFPLPPPALLHQARGCSTGT